jgi:hypothetical protein
MFYKKLNHQEPFLLGCSNPSKCKKSRQPVRVISVKCYNVKKKHEKPIGWSGAGSKIRKVEVVKISDNSLKKRE